MRRNIGLIILGMVTCICLCVCFFCPPLIFNIWDQKELQSGYSRENLKAQISPEADEIYLVKAIWGIYQEDAIHSIGSSDKSGVEIKALKELKEAGILNDYKKKIGKNDFIVMNDDIVNQFEVLYYSLINKNPMDVEMTTAPNPLDFEVEGKTQKVLLLKTSSDSGLIADDAELITRFIKYLGLDLLDDWQQDTLGMISEKARIQVIYLNNNGISLLTVSPIGYYDYNRLQSVIGTNAVIDAWAKN